MGLKLTNEPVTRLACTTRARTAWQLNLVVGRRSRPRRDQPFLRTNELARADAWRATTYGHVVLHTKPVGSTPLPKLCA